MSDKTTLQQALATARAELSTQTAPPYVRAQLLAAFERQRFERADTARAQAAAASQPPAARGKRWSWSLVMGWSGALASLAVIAAAALMVLTEPAVSSSTALAQAGDDSAVFIPTVSSARLAEESQAYVVSTEMPRASLASMGLPFDASRAADSVRAEMLMSRSGDVLAVRFVN